MSKPLLFIDVDGVLNPFAARHTREGFREYHLEEFLVRLNPAHGVWLNACAATFDLVWATTWEDKANSLIAPLLGLPALPVVHFDFAADRNAKYPAVDAYAGERPLAWLEDDPLVGEIAWAQRRNLWIPTRIVKIQPAAGIVPRDMEVVRRFAERLAAAT